jgi:hypothetical protein
MTIRTSLLAVGLLVAGCSPGGTILVSGMLAPDGLCEVPMKQFQMAGGFLDVSPGSAEFWAIPQVSALLVGSGLTGDIVVGGTTVQNKNSDRPVIDGLMFTYTSQPKIGKLSAYTIPLAAVVDTSQGSAVVTSVGPLNIISSQVSSALDAIDSAGGVLTVSITAKGHMALSGAQMQSEAVNFPITLVNTRAQTSGAGGCSTLRKGYACTYPGQGLSVPDQGAASSAVCCDGTPGASGCN